MEDRPGLVVEGPATVLARVPSDVSLVPAVPDDVAPATARAEQAVGPPDRPEQLGRSRHIGKQCQQEQQGTGNFLLSAGGLFIPVRPDGKTRSDDVNTCRLDIRLLAVLAHRTPSRSFCN